MPERSTDHEEHGDHDGDADRDPERDGPHWFGLLVPALTFLVGLLLGGVLVYATNGGDAAEEPDGGATGTADDSATGGPGDTTVTLPAACEEASAGVAEAYELLQEALGQVRDFRANKLAETLEELQTVDEETRPLVQECSEVSVSTSPTPSETDEPATPEGSTEGDPTSPAS